MSSHSTKLFTKMARGRFFDEQGNPLTPQQIDDFLNIAYKEIGVLFSGDALKQEADGWFVGVDENNPEKFHWFFTFKTTPFGKKIFAVGHDGSKEAKKELLQFKQEVLTNPNEHAYIEVSGRVQQLLESWGIPKVPVATAIKVLPGKKVIPIDQWSYERTISGTTQKFVKTMYGYPKAASLIVKKWSWKPQYRSNLLKQQAKGFAPKV